MNQRIWTPVDVTKLLEQIKKKKTLEDISRKENRSISNIQSKLKEIAVDLYFNKNMAYDIVEEITGIKKESLLVKRKPVIPERSGSPKEAENLAVMAVSEAMEAVAVETRPTEPETIQSSSAYELRLSTENPFSISSIRTLIQSTVEICLLSRSC